MTNNITSSSGIIYINGKSSSGTTYLDISGVNTKIEKQVAENTADIKDLRDLTANHEVRIETLENGGGGTVDSVLSTTSTNPVKNKVVTTAIRDLSSQVNIDSYLDLIIEGNTQDLPIKIQGTYDTDLTNIIGGTYVNV